MAEVRYFGKTKDGQSAGSILSHQLQIFSDRFLELDAASVPTGRILDAAGTPMDFRHSHAVGERIDDDYDQLKMVHGYDHCYVFPNDGKLKKMACLSSPESGISLTVLSDRPGMQLYTGNYLEGIRGKQKRPCHNRDGICFETQAFPNACCQPAFPTTILPAGQIFTSRTIYRFSLSLIM